MAYQPQGGEELVHVVVVQAVVERVPWDAGDRAHVPLCTSPPEGIAIDRRGVDGVQHREGRVTIHLRIRFVEGNRLTGSPSHEIPPEEGGARGDQRCRDQGLPHPWAT